MNRISRHTLPQENLLVPNRLLSRRGFARLGLTSALVAGLLASPTLQAQPANSPNQDPLHVWNAGGDPASLETWVEQRLAAAQAIVDKLAAVTGPRTVENTLRTYDDAVNELAIAGNEAYVMFAVADSAPLREKAQTMTSRVSSATTDLSLNQKVYRALHAVPPPINDPATKHYLERTLLEYRLAGVDKDDATRAKIRQLQDQLTALSLTFNRNINNDVRKVTASREQLDGLPADYIARHTPDANGTYTLTTDPPDSRPVYSFADNPDLRLRMYFADNQRGYPKNKPVLMDLLAARQQLATTLGYETFADLDTADQMIGSPENVKMLLQQLDVASREPAAREYALLLAFAQKQHPGLSQISMADRLYWPEQYNRATYNFDAQSVRPYFPYNQVQAGILKTAARLFHIQFEAVPDAKVWDPSVSTFDIYDEADPNRGKKLGRIYLDMHPRAGKDKWFSSAPLVPGIAGRQLPEGALICNFPGGTAGDPGLMQYYDVVVFFHEFGHLMHHVLGGQHQWAGAGGFNVEGDFVEAPSQMLEEIFHDHAVLASFAKNYKTGETIPIGLVDRMNAADAFGRGTWVQRQLFYASYSLQLHDRPPSQVNLDALLKEDSTRFMPWTFVEGDRFYASFTHLAGYASNYYTYLLDKVIALDFFSQFDQRNLLDGPTAMRYRRTVLEPGATEPAAEYVKTFLGRPQSIDALKAWMNVEFQKDPAIKPKPGQ
jgi:thimet oligopeptidase